MTCRNCNYENPTGMNFCGQCGSSLQIKCSNCQFDNPSDFNYCGNCGTQLSSHSTNIQPSVLPKSDLNEKQNTEAEHRHLTVMFCDLMGSTALSNKLDPEDLRELIREYQDISAKVVNRFEGYIAQYLGDGILVYFGYPVAHENDAHRAVSSGLGIIEAIKQMNRRLLKQKNIGISVRIGVHTGHVVIGDMGGIGKTEQLALGVTPNIAARLEGLAEANSLVISADTYKLVDKFFDCKESGMHVLKGISEPIQIYEVNNENTARSRFDSVQTSADQLPLIGRKSEVKAVMDLWAEAENGKSHIILLTGEAGVGKTHLLQSVISKIAEESDAWLNVHYCSPYHQHTAFYPVIDIIENVVLQFKPEIPVKEKINKIEGFLVQYGLDLDEMVPIFAQLLSVAIEESKYKQSSFSPQQQKQKLMSALINMYLERSQDQRLLTVFEDLQYADPSTLELIQLLINQAPTSKILTILSFRPEFTPGWGMQAHIVALTLSNLPKEEVIAIIAEITGNKPLPEEVVNDIIEKTDGIPLFVEELTKMVLESGMVSELNDHYELNGPITSLAIPSTLHDSLVARLDRMSAVKELAQLGAIIGREFSFELIRSVSLMKENNVQEGLRKLVKAGLLHQKGVPPIATYHFRHALIQDAASQSLLKTQRQNFHQRIAQALTNEFVELVKRKPEIIAYHSENAGMTENAIIYWTKAGKLASERSAFEESLSYLTNGFQLLQNLTDNEKSLQFELDLLAVQSPIFTITEGFASVNAFETNQRITVLAEKKEDHFRLFLALRGLTMYHLFGGKPQDALIYAQQGLELAEAYLDSETWVEANRMIGQVCIYTGEFTRSLNSFEKAISLYDPLKHQSLIRSTGVNPGIFSLAQSSHVMWYLGYPDQAIERAKLALKKANELEQPYSQALSGFLLSLVYLLNGNAKQTINEAESCMIVCKKYGIHMLGSEVKNFLGRAFVELGENDKGIELIQQALSWRRTKKMFSGTNIHLTILINIYLKSNQINKGLEIVSEAMDVSNKYGDQLFLSEIYRLKGELLLAQNEAKNKGQAEDYFDKGYELAQNQNAKSFELKLAISKARLWHKQKKTEKAFELLSDTYNWFTEGFETRDLKEAKKLMEILSTKVKSVA